MGPIFFISMVAFAFLPSVNIGSFGYFIVAGLALFRPQFSRIYYVLPLNEKQIKKLFMWRIIILCGLMIFISAVVMAICEWQNMDWNKHGMNIIAFYMVLLIVCSESSLQGMGIERGFKMRHVVGIIGGIISMLIAFGLLTDYMPYIWEVTAAFVMVLAAVGYMIYYLKDVKFEDFTYVPVSIWDNGKVEKK